MTQVIWRVSNVVTCSIQEVFFRKICPLNYNAQDLILFNKPFSVKFNVEYPYLFLMYMLLLRLTSSFSVSFFQINPHLKFQTVTSNFIASAILTEFVPRQSILEEYGDCSTR